MKGYLKPYKQEINANNNFSNWKQFLKAFRRFPSLEYVETKK